jgi:competence protein ComEA
MKNYLVKGMVLSLVLVAALTAFVPIESHAAIQTAPKKININTASLTELQELPRIGEKVAQNIIDFRKENGNFKSTADLLKVKGIGEKIYELIKDRVTV